MLAKCCAHGRCFRLPVKAHISARTSLIHIDGHTAVNPYRRAVLNPNQHTTLFTTVALGQPHDMQIRIGTQLST